LLCSCFFSQHLSKEVMEPCLCSTNQIIDHPLQTHSHTEAIQLGFVSSSHMLKQPKAK
jgi:hypothetical protein